MSRRPNDPIDTADPETPNAMDAPIHKDAGTAPAAADAMDVRTASAAPAALDATGAPAVTDARDPAGAPTVTDARDATGAPPTADGMDVRTAPAAADAMDVRTASAATAALDASGAFNARIALEAVDAPETHAPADSPVDRDVLTASAAADAGNARTAPAAADAWCAPADAVDAQPDPFAADAVDAQPDPFAADGVDAPDETRDVLDEARAARLLHDREVGADLLDEWTAQVAAPKPVRVSGFAAALLLRAGAEWLALPGSCLDEASAVGPIHPVPYLSSPVFLGLTNMGGELLPCISLAALLRAAPAPTSLPGRARIIAVALAQGRFALLVDDVAGTARFHPDAERPAPDGAASGLRSLLRGVVELEDRSAGLLDAAALGEALLRSLRP